MKLIDKIDPKKLDAAGIKKAKESLATFVKHAQAALKPCEAFAKMASNLVSGASVDRAAIPQDQVEKQREAEVKYKNAQAGARSIIDKIILTSTEVERALTAFENNILVINATESTTPKSDIDLPESFASIENMSKDPLCQ